MSSGPSFPICEGGSAVEVNELPQADCSERPHLCECRANMSHFNEVRSSPGPLLGWSEASLPLPAPAALCDQAGPHAASPLHSPTSTAATQVASSA